ncbi:hypothetical protein [Micromonospora sp. WMMD980]|uniref:hypothetical protein n=1 Tax=Micromonospora sp. WMMD980 TaxID=3016088 RepID=UPI002417639E|nr:hypothetical protein [Micromonospora sp. WMMD980]MDG4804593.1 hypothetical protein [Micromonospora sp. WMMD980]
MPEPRDSRLSGAFEAYRTLTLDAVVPAGPDAVRRTVRRRRRRRVTTVAVVVAAAVAAPVAAWAALGRAPTPAPVTSPAPSTAPAPSESPSVGPSASPSAPTGRIERAELLAATVDLPAWPAGAGCRARNVRLAERTGGSGDVLLSTSAYAYGDVDGDGVPEPVALLRCLRGRSPYPEQVVAFDRGADGVPVALGRVFRSDPRRPEWFVALDARPDGALRVEVADRLPTDGREPDAAHRQTRTYRWTDAEFTQTGGPTAFPVEPPPSVSTSATGPTPVSPLFAVTTTPVVYGPPDADGWRRGMTTVTVTNIGSGRLTDVRVTLPDSAEDTHEHTRVESCPTAAHRGTFFYCYPGPLEPGGRAVVGLHFIRRTTGPDHHLTVQAERGGEGAAVPGTTTRADIPVTFE